MPNTRSKLKLHLPALIATLMISLVGKMNVITQGKEKKYWIFLWKTISFPLIFDVIDFMSEYFFMV